MYRGKRKIYNNIKVINFNMANILLGSPHDSKVNGDLVARLMEEGHTVNHFTSSAALILRLTKIKDDPEKLKPDLFIYDTGLGYTKLGLELRAEFFGSQEVTLLDLAQSPVIVLADDQIADHIRESTQNSGYKQIDQPYNVDVIVEEVNKFVN